MINQFLIVLSENLLRNEQKQKWGKMAQKNFVESKLPFGAAYSTFGTCGRRKRESGLYTTSCSFSFYLKSGFWWGKGGDSYYLSLLPLLIV